MSTLPIASYENASQQTISLGSLFASYPYLLGSSLDNKIIPRMNRVMSDYKDSKWTMQFIMSMKEASFEALYPKIDK